MRKWALLCDALIHRTIPRVYTRLILDVIRISADESPIKQHVLVFCTATAFFLFGVVKTFSIAFVVADYKNDYESGSDDASLDEMGLYSTWCSDYWIETAECIHFL